MRCKVEAKDEWASAPILHGWKIKVLIQAISDSVPKRLNVQEQSDTNNIRDLEVKCRDR